MKILVVQRESLVAQGAGLSRSVYARILEPFDYLKNKGLIQYRVVSENDVQQSDLAVRVLIFSKHVSDVSIRIAEKAKELGVKIIYDLDDNILNFPAYSAGNIDIKKKNNFHQHMMLADIVTVSTKRLQESIRNHLMRQTTLVCNGFNIERHYRMLHQTRGGLRVIYTNADKVKLNCFKSGFFETINNMLSKYPELTLDVFSDYQDDLGKFSRCKFLGSVDWFTHKKMLLENNYYMGIVPLGANEDGDELAFNSCKSPIKYLEYGGLKIAGIYSKSPIYTDVIEDRYNGLLVENTKEAWQNAIDELIQNKSLHKKIVENAFEDIKKNHHVSKSAEQWMSLFL